jgi:hypothetical protein
MRKPFWFNGFRRPEKVVRPILPRLNSESKCKRGKCEGTVKFWLRSFFFGSTLVQAASPLTCPPGAQRGENQPCGPLPIQWKRIFVTDYKEKYFQKLAYFPRSKSVSPKTTKTHELATKKTTKHHQKTPTFLNPPEKTPFSAALKK